MKKHIMTIPATPTRPTLDDLEHVDVYSVECQSILRNIHVSAPVIMSYKTRPIFEFHCKNQACAVDTFLAPENICYPDEVVSKDTHENVLAMRCCCPICHKDAYSTKDVSNDVTSMRKVRDIINDIKTE